MPKVFRGHDDDDACRVTSKPNEAMMVTSWNLFAQCQHTNSKWGLTLSQPSYAAGTRVQYVPKQRRQNVVNLTTTWLALMALLIFAMSAHTADAGSLNPIDRHQPTSSAVPLPEFLQLQTHHRHHKHHKHQEEIANKALSDSSPLGSNVFDPANLPALPRTPSIGAPDLLAGNIIVGSDDESAESGGSDTGDGDGGDGGEETLTLSALRDVDAPDMVAPPVLTPPGGVFSTKTITMTCTSPDALIFFTTDGTEPTADSPSVLTKGYTHLSAGQFTIRAVSAVDINGTLYTSNTTVGYFTIKDQCATPWYHTDGASYAPLILQLQSKTEDSSIHYTLDGTEPTSISPNSVASGGEIVLDVIGRTVLRAIAVKDGFAESHELKAVFLLKRPVLRQYGRSYVGEHPQGPVGGPYQVMFSQPFDADLPSRSIQVLATIRGTPPFGTVDHSVFLCTVAEVTHKGFKAFVARVDGLGEAGETNPFVQGLGRAFSDLTKTAGDYGQLKPNEEMDKAAREALLGYQRGMRKNGWDQQLQLDWLAWRSHGLSSRTELLATGGIGGEVTIAMPPPMQVPETNNLQATNLQVFPTHSVAAGYIRSSVPDIDAASVVATVRASTAGQIYAVSTRQITKENIVFNVRRMNLDAAKVAWEHKAAPTRPDTNQVAEDQRLMIARNKVEDFGDDRSKQKKKSSKSKHHHQHKSKHTNPKGHHHRETRALLLADDGTELERHDIVNHHHHNIVNHHAAEYLQLYAQKEKNKHKTHTKKKKNWATAVSENEEHETNELVDDEQNDGVVDEVDTEDSERAGPGGTGVFNVKGKADETDTLYIPRVDYQVWSESLGVLSSQPQGSIHHSRGDPDRASNFHGVYGAVYLPPCVTSMCRKHGVLRSKVMLPSKFTPAPSVLLTVNAEDTKEHFATEDTFVSSVLLVSSDHFQVHVKKLNGGGWNYNLRLSWFAWNTTTETCATTNVLNWDNPCNSPNGVCDEGKCICSVNYASDDCSQCADGFYGPDCKPCQGLLMRDGSVQVCTGHGKCDGSGTHQGTGNCTCESAWNNLNRGDCSTCARNHFGQDCKKCDCGMHGSCSGSGMTSGTGECVCDAGWAGLRCEKQCKNLCSNHGRCAVREIEETQAPNKKGGVPLPGNAGDTAPSMLPAPSSVESSVKSSVEASAADGTKKSTNLHLPDDSTGTMFLELKQNVVLSQARSMKNTVGTKHERTERKTESYSEGQVKYIDGGVRDAAASEESTSAEIDTVVDELTPSMDAMDDDDDTLESEEDLDDGEEQEEVGKRTRGLDDVGKGKQPTTKSTIITRTKELAHQRQQQQRIRHKQQLQDGFKNASKYALDEETFTVYCRCDSGWAGQSCSTCDDEHFGPDCNACSKCDHGDCDSGIDGAGDCVCHPGWTADDCSVCRRSYFRVVDECVPCPGFNGQEACSGHGECSSSGTCKCEKGWEGRSCNTKDKSGMMNTLIIVLGSVITCMMVAAFVFIFSIMRRRKMPFTLESVIKIAKDYERGGAPAAWGRLHSSRYGIESSKMDGVGGAGGRPTAQNWWVRFDKLEFGEIIGTGTSAQVMRGTYCGQEVAVKRLFGSWNGLDDNSPTNSSSGFNSFSPDRGFESLFSRECSLLANLSHPNIVRFYGACIHERVFYIVTERLKSSLGKFIETMRYKKNEIEKKKRKKIKEDRYKMLNASTALRAGDAPNMRAYGSQSRENAIPELNWPNNFFYEIAIGICNGLSFLHDKDIVHRDIKPENILLVLDEEMDGGFQISPVKLCDFGLSRILTVQCNQVTRAVGTPAYMSPEMLGGDFVAMDPVISDSEVTESDNDSVLGDAHEPATPKTDDFVSLKHKLGSKKGHDALHEEETFGGERLEEEPLSEERELTYSEDSSPGDENGDPSSVLLGSQVNDVDDGTLWATNQNGNKDKKKSKSKKKKSQENTTKIHSTRSSGLPPHPQRSTLAKKEESNATSQLREDEAAASMLQKQMERVLTATTGGTGAQQDFESGDVSQGVVRRRHKGGDNEPEGATPKRTPLVGKADSGNKPTKTVGKSPQDKGAQERYLAFASDVYSFGVVLWALYFLDQPYRKRNGKPVSFRSVNELSHFVVRGLRPDLPPSLDNPVIRLIKRCWHGNPMRRPTIDECSTLLMQMYESVRKDAPDSN